ncbi:MAG TPA: DUF1302 family protein [Candidatus Binatia bacterium]|jgi:hypothetical protein|nr:DUF1302 family protein [Candidatus Binatia bacterium]
MRTSAGWLALGLAAVLCSISTVSHAYFLDKGRNFDVRVRAYNQVSVMTENSETTGCTPVKMLSGKVLQNDPRTCPPSYSAGDFGQNRIFYNPEFDAKLTDYTNWSKNVPILQYVAPDDFKFRFAWWGFYDGLYDYLDGPWNSHRRDTRTRFSQSSNINRESYQFNDENKNPRHIYASRNRINEMYLDYTKGRVFIRAGRQAISWGEADTIAILDVSNPFDLTLGAPGLFQDVDEARIPLWTLRTTVKLLDNWEWLSSVFADTYLVPGIIDTTVPINPITAGVSPFNPDVGDPNSNIVIGPTRNQETQQGKSLHVAVVDRLPEEKWSNTRWGARLTGVIARDYTVQGWFFRTFNQAPVPLLRGSSAFDRFSAGKVTLVDDRGFRTPVCTGADGTKITKAERGTLGRTPAGRSCGWKAPVVTSLERKLESVIGVAATWFSQPVNGIIRTEAEYFVDELAFLPNGNLNPRVQVPGAVRKAIGDTKNYTNYVPTADYIRWLIGYDRFFFFRPLNPSNSFIISAALNNSFNLSEKGGRDFRNPYTKPGKRQAVAGRIKGIPICERGAATDPRDNPLCVKANPHDFQDAYQYEGFIQTALQTDYLHGKLSPRLVVILDYSGIFVFQPQLTWRVTDNFLLTGTYIGIAANRKAGPGVFRAHDMIQLRATVQLN